MSFQQSRTQFSMTEKLCLIARRKCARILGPTAPVRRSGKKDIDSSESNFGFLKRQKVKHKGGATTKHVGRSDLPHPLCTELASVFLIHANTAVENHRTA
jgi:hypothetical protein